MSAPTYTEGVTPKPCTERITPKGKWPVELCNRLIVVRWRGSTPKRDPHTCRTEGEAQ